MVLVRSTNSRNNECLEDGEDLDNNIDVDAEVDDDFEGNLEGKAEGDTDVDADGEDELDQGSNEDAKKIISTSIARFKS